MDRRLAHHRRDARKADPGSTQLKWVGVASLVFHAQLPRYLGFEGGSGDAPLFVPVCVSRPRELAIGV